MQHLRRADAGLGDRAVVQRKPFDPAPKLQQALALHQQGRLSQAESLYRGVLDEAPDNFDALHLLGVVELQRGNPHEGLRLIGRALELNPNDPAAQLNLGNAFMDLKRPEEALASYDRALAFLPDYAEALNHRGNALRALKRPEEALASFRRAFALRPDLADAFASLGDTLLELLRPNEAAVAFARLVEIRPDHDYARGNLLYAKMQCCDWATFRSDAAAVERDVGAGKRAVTPFAFQAMSRSPENLRLCSKTYAADRYPPQSPLWTGERYDNPRIRLGYLCGEFRTHATSMLMAGLFESHDRNRFELFAFDNGFDDGSPMRRRVKESFDSFIDISRASDLDAARLIRDRRIDILVNLNGYCGLSRTGVFAHRPCPVQVNYLGFPGTIGADYIDYIVADRIVIPDDEHRYYSEKVVVLPDCYQVNDSKRSMAEVTPTRKEAGLPESGFVFCCFNNNHKLTPELFDVWMRLLAKVEGSTLWLIEDNAVVAANLRREAERRGVAPERLVFAPRVNVETHLARHRLADLFLDTLPYNAHTTCSDALWAGLPVLTCMGTAFPGRVAASLLHAADLPELVTKTLEEYEALALRLATNPSLLAAHRSKLAKNRATCALFDTDRFRRHIESAYIAMWERAERGEPPVAFVAGPTGGERGRSGILLST